MKIPLFTSLLISVAIISGTCLSKSDDKKKQDKHPKMKTIELPPPVYNSSFSLEKTLKERRSRREYAEAPLSLSQLSQILWAAQGISKKVKMTTWSNRDIGGFRTAPSAGALYPLEIYAVIGNVTNLNVGVYKYHPNAHSLSLVIEEDKQNEVYHAALGQSCLKDAAALVVIVADYHRTAQKYGQRAKRYVHMEVGAAGQNIYLQAESLGLATVFIGAFDDDQIKAVLQLPKEEEPLAIFPLGKR